MDTLDQIAVIGMAGRFPGASDTDALWRILRDGVEAITRFTEEELAAAGVSPELLANPRYVKARGILEGFDQFDAEFFGFTPREAEVMDPQQRLFLEHAWQACENAGYDPHAYPGRVGVFAGAASTSYFAFNVLPHPELLAEVGGLQVKMLNDKDFLTTHASYKLNLRGPSMAVQTACSTSLVAIHLACQSLLSGECEMALAGGVGVNFPHITGYLFEEGSIGSPDGHCRAFDAKAQGLVEGNGVGIVVLKRLEDALADGDTVHAVIRGSAINNDGASKAGYSAPSIDSQAEVISEALVVARVEPETIGLVEAHGSGTPIGDPIEVAALTRAWRTSTDRRGFCALGSIKTNIGHTDAAAGVSGLIKTVLALEHGQIPASLHFETPNPALALDQSPFYVPTVTREWPAGETPRRAAVSSLGIGGTNAHVVLEEAPAAPEPGPSRPWQLLVLSARSPRALEAASVNLAGWLGDSEREVDLADAAVDLADAAHTLRVGRKPFRHRRALVCRDREEAARLLAERDPARLVTGDAGDSGAEAPGVAFLFPGLGDQYAGMAAELYRQEPVFRESFDRCAEILRPHLDLDLREVLWPADLSVPAGVPGGAARPDLRRLLAGGEENGDDGPLARTRIAHPALFAVEYSLATLLQEWGIRPAALLGYSLGEYVAACLAGVFSLEDGLRLVAERARLVDALPEGAMLAVPLPAEEVAPLLDAGLSLAAADGSALTVVGGPAGAVDLFAWHLSSRGIATRKLRTVHAFHSRMMEPAVAELARIARGVNLAPPSIPFISNVTGTWITDAEATDPEYWARHLASTVRFADGLASLMAADGPRVLVEVGPGRSLATLARQHPGRPSGLVDVATLRDRRDEVSDQAFLLDALGRLWLAGVTPDWQAFVAGESRRRVPLPTYPFERRRYFIEPGTLGAAAPSAGGRLPQEDWFYTPVWERTPALPAPRQQEGQAPWLLLADSLGVGERLAVELQARGEAVVTAPSSADFRALLRDLHSRGEMPGRIVHLGSLTPAGVEPTPDEAEERGFQSLLALAQALGEQDLREPIHVTAVANGLFEVTGDETVLPAKATLLGVCRVLPQEVRHVTCTAMDLPSDNPEAFAPALAAALLQESREAAVALRGRHRWVRGFRRVPLLPATPGAGLRRGGVWLIAGGLEETGVATAEHLFRTAGARLALVVHEDTPPRERWGEWIGTHDEQDPEAVRLRRILALEAAGAEVQILPADLARSGRADWAVGRVRERFGALHGVVQAEADPTGSLLLWTTRDIAAHALAPKVRGTLALAEATRDLPLDAFLLFGSNAGVTGGLGQVASCAVASFLDALAWRRAAEGLPAQAIDWAFFRWQPITAPDPVIAEQLQAALAAYGLSAADLAGSLDRIAASGLPQVTLSTQDLDALTEHLDAMGAGAMVETAAPGSAHPRPDLSTPYVEPRTETEEALARIWRESFGLEQVGIEDNFFDLAGNSLLAIQIVTRANSALGTDLPMAALLESPTILDLARRVEESRPISDEAELERLLAEIEALSAEEAEARLAREVPAPGDPV